MSIHSEIAKKRSKIKFLTHLLKQTQRELYDLQQANIVYFKRIIIKKYLTLWSDDTKKSNQYLIEPNDELFRAIDTLIGHNPEHPISLKTCINQETLKVSIYYQSSIQNDWIEL